MTTFIRLYVCKLFTFCVSRRRRKMYCGHARLCVSVCVCLSAAIRPYYCTDPDVTWGHGRGCPLVLHYWAVLQSGHGLRCYGNITRTLVTSLRPSRDMTTWCERPAGRGLRAPPAGDRRATGVLNITAAVWTAGFHWWRPSNKKRMQNVSKYMLVLALCLVNFLSCFDVVNVLQFFQRFTSLH